VGKAFYKHLSATLMDSGYKRVKYSIFRKKIENTDLSSFVELNFFGYGSARLVCNFGLSSSGALAFANTCLQLYGGALYADRPPMGRLAYFNINCQVGRVCDWSPRAALQLEDYNIVDAVSKLMSDVEQRIAPHFERVSDLRSFGSLAIADPEWAHWIYCHRAIRAAEYVYVSKLFGKSSSDISADLQPYLKDIRTGIDRNIAPEVFLENVINHPISN